MERRRHQPGSRTTTSGFLRPTLSAFLSSCRDVSCSAEADRPQRSDFYSPTISNNQLHSSLPMSAYSNVVIAAVSQSYDGAERRVCIDGTQFNSDTKVSTFSSSPMSPLILCVISSNSWMAWCVSLVSSSAYIFNSDFFSRNAVCVPSDFCNQLANSSPSRLQIKKSEIGSSGLVLLRADNES